MSIAAGRRSIWPGASSGGAGRLPVVPVATATGLAAVGALALTAIRHGSSPVLAVTSHLPQPMTHVSRTVGMAALALALCVTLPALLLVRRRRPAGAAPRVTPRAALAAPGVRSALVVFVGVEVLDAVTTVAGLLGGLHEGNQLYALALPHAGLGGMAAMKLPVIAIAAAIASVLPRRAGMAALWAAAAVTGAAVAQNIGLLLASAGH